jgi:pimeloyl-ACP methyl ester carboxylesterase
VNGFEWDHQYLSANGIRIHYVRHGEGLPLMLLRGWPEFWLTWRKTIPQLAESFDEVAPDLRGFMDSDKPALSDPPSDLLKDYLEDLRVANEEISGFFGALR